MTKGTETRAPRTIGGAALLLVTALVAVGAAVWAFAGDDASDADKHTELGLLDDFKPEVGAEAPDFALVDARDPDHIVRLSDFRGTPVIVNWYASWCGPCRAEIPDFVQAKKTLGDEFQMLGVNLQESPSRAVGLLEELGAEYPAVVDDEGEVFAGYAIGVGGMPTTYFIDAEGVVRAARQGRVTEEALIDGLAELGVAYEPAAD